MTERIKDVTFTPRQVAFLEQQFPEFPGTANTPDQELRWRAAQRAVVAFVRTYSTKDRHGLAE